MKNKKIIILLILLVLTLISIISINIQFYKADKIAEKLNMSVKSGIYQDLLPQGYEILNVKGELNAECDVKNNRNITCYIDNIVIINHLNNIKYKFDMNIKNIEDIQKLNDMENLSLNIEIHNFKSLSSDKNISMSIRRAVIDLIVKDKKSFDIKTRIYSLVVLNENIGNLDFSLINNKLKRTFIYNSNLLDLKANNFSVLNIKNLEVSSILSNIILDSEIASIEYKGSFRTLLNIYLKDEQKIERLFQAKENLKSIIETYYKKYTSSKLYSNVSLNRINFDKVLEWITNPDKYNDIALELKKKDKITTIDIKI